MAQKVSQSEHSLNKSIHQVLKWIEWSVLQMVVGNHHFQSFFWPLNGPNWVNVAPKNLLRTFTQQVYVSSLKWIEWLVYQIIARYHDWHIMSDQYSRYWWKSIIFSPFFATIGPKIGPTWLKQINSEDSPNQCKHEVWRGLSDQFSHNGWKPSFWAILWSLEGQNWASVAQRQNVSEHSPIKHIPPVGRNWIWPKNESVYPTSVYIKSDMDRVSNFSDNGWKLPQITIFSSFWSLEGRNRRV